MQKNTNKDLSMLEYYQHFRKLNQALIEVIFQIVTINSNIRSITIQKTLLNFCNISITLSWINQIIKKKSIVRPQGRPDNNYYIHEKKQYFATVKTIIIKNHDKIGIPLMQDLMDHFKLSNLFVNLLSKIKSELNINRFKCKEKSFDNFIKTMTAITLDPSVSNFEEAINADISHCPMSIKFARDLVKPLEKSNFLDEVNIACRNYWIDFLNIENNRIIIYYDGHAKPYYSKENHAAGLISNSQKVLPGTKYFVVTSTNGYILELRNIRIDTPYGKTVYETTSQLAADYPKITKLIIMDREGSGNELNKRILNELNVPTLTPLKSNMYKDLNDFGYKKIGGYNYQGKWRDPVKRLNDPRWFTIIKYKDRLCVFATNGSKQMGRMLQKLYKTRWPDNEEIIKNMNMLCSFNTNICNGTVEIQNPKKINQKKILEQKINTANQKIDQYHENIGVCGNNSAKLRFEKQIENKRNKINRHQQELKKLENIELVKIRNTKPDQFISLLKAGILNLFRYILTICLNIQNKKVPMEKMMQMIINRKGKIIESNYSKQYIFEYPGTKSNRKILKLFCGNFNKLNIMTKNGKKVILAIESG
ncbi:MAG: hypothetical protein JW702_08895 [Clostridiales bacterium]|nr:hypothetical protein [Clostridiales bacterium]